MMFQPDDLQKGGAWQNHAIYKPFCKNMYNAVPENLMKSDSVGVFWIDSKGRAKSF